jgi:hypothetical protein
MSAKWRNGVPTKFLKKTSLPNGDEEVIFHRFVV